MSHRPTPPSGKTRNRPAYNAALKKRGSLTIGFDPDMAWMPPPSGKRGRQHRYSDAAIQACLTMKVLFGIALRQTTGFVEILLHLVGLGRGGAGLRHAVLNQIPPGVEIGSGTAGGANDTRRFQDAVADRGAQGVIPPHKNTKSRKPRTAGSLARNEALREAKYLGRSRWRQWSRTRHRSRIETKVPCV